MSAPVKYLILCTGLILFLSSCDLSNKQGGASMDLSYFPELERIDGLYYKKGENVPFTGHSGSTYSTGSPYVEADFKNGLMHGTYRAFYEDGIKMGESSYEEGVLQGLSQSWHKNGTLASNIKFENGKRSGRMEVYYESGKPNAVAYFIEGKLDSTYSRWNLEGELEFVDLYDEGEFKRAIPIDSIWSTDHELESQYGTGQNNL